MPKGYWIAQVDVTDMTRYAAYFEALNLAVAKYGGRFVIRTDKFEAVEGKPRSRHVVIEFPSFAVAMDCWNSPEYRRAVPLRAGITTADVVVIEGYDGPQPAWRKA